MPTKHVIDPHALVWYLEDNPRLGMEAGRILDDPASELILPTIALAEACWVVAKGRSGIPSASALLSDVQADPRIVFAPLDIELVGLSMSLTVLEEMHDRQIVATALRLIHGGETVKLISKDENIMSSGLVPLVW